MAFAKKLSNYIPILKDQGIDYATAAGKAGDGMQHIRVAQSGASPYAFVFADNGLQDMADTEYDVIVQGPNGDERADYSSRATTGFDITGGADTEDLIVLVMGRIKGQTE